MTLHPWGVPPVSSKSRRKSRKRPARPTGQQNQKADKNPSSRTKRIAVWTAATLATALIGLLVTGVLPKVAGQVFDSAKIEDSIRSGPDIIVDESLYYPNGNSVPLPTVIPGNYQPSRELVTVLAQPMAATSPSLERQIHDANGVDIGAVYIRLILQGHRNEQLYILDIHPVQLHRTQPLNGVFFGIGAQGENENIQMAFNLDQLAPEALNVNGIQVTNVPYFKTHSISLSDGEQEVIILQAQTECYSARFKLAIDYMIGGQNKEVIIANNGSPFAVTGPRFGSNNAMSYKQMFLLRGNFSVTPAGSAEMASFTRANQDASSCPT